MKIAILSDIHGNIDAFKAVVKRMKSLKVDHVFFLGDQMGYYLDVIEVYEEIDKWSHSIISGNHERIFIEYLKSDKNFQNKIDKKYGSCFSSYEQTFNQTLINRIQNLSDTLTVTLGGYNFMLCHGSPIEKDHYAYPDSDKKMLDKCIDTIGECNVVFVGHTHYPMVYTSKNKQLINVGSVGQNRVVGGIANWGLFNTENGIFVQQNTLYNTKSLKAKIKSDDNLYLSKILERNNNIYEE